jgi:hypothetical protein
VLTLVMEHAYLAGIIDGEGTISLDKNYGSSDPSVFFEPNVSVSSTTRELVDTIKAAYGGAISTKKVYQAHHLQSYVWKTSYHRCRTVLDLCLPYLLVPSKIARAKMIVQEYPLLVKRNGKYSSDETQALREFRERFYTL